MALELTWDGGFNVIQPVGQARAWVGKMGKFEYTRRIYGAASWIARETVCSDETHIISEYTD